MSKQQGTILPQLVTLGLLLAFVGSAWLIVDTGVSQTYDVITNDAANLTQETVATFGGSVGFADRIVMIGHYKSMPLFSYLLSQE